MPATALIEAAELDAVMHGVRGVLGPLYFPTTLFTGCGMSHTQLKVTELETLDRRSISGSRRTHQRRGPAQYHRTGAAGRSAGIPSLLDRGAPRDCRVCESRPGNHDRTGSGRDFRDAGGIGRGDASALQPDESGRTVQSPARALSRPYRSRVGARARRKSAG